MRRTVTYTGVALVVLGAALLVGPTMGFSATEADRSTMVDTASNPNALLGIEPLSGSVDGPNDDADVLRVTNNAGTTLQVDLTHTLDTTNLQVDGPQSATLSPDQSALVTVSCDGQGGTANYRTAQLTTDATGDGSGLAITGVTESSSFQYHCNPGNGGGPGGGFQSVSVEDPTVYTTTDGARHSVSFVPATHLTKNSVVEIDLSNAHPDGVDYTRTGNYHDVQIVQGGGSIQSVSSDGVIEYRTGQGNSRDKKGDTVELSVGNYSTTTTAGPWQASITRQDTGETGTTSFEVVDDGDRPIESVTVSDVPGGMDPNDEAEQTFSFDFGSGPAGSDQIVIDLSDPQGDGVDYTTINWNNREVEVQSGDGTGWYDSSSDTIRYQAADSDAAGDTIELRVQGYETDSSGGPYTVGVYWDRFDYEETDSFSIN